MPGAAGARVAPEEPPAVAARAMVGGAAPDRERGAAAAVALPVALEGAR